MTPPEPREVKVTRYRCPFCSRGYSRRPICIEHMAGCRANPDNIDLRMSEDPDPWERW